MPGNAGCPCHQRQQSAVVPQMLLCVSRWGRRQRRPGFARPARVLPHRWPSQGLDQGLQGAVAAAVGLKRRRQRKRRFAQRPQNTMSAHSFTRHHRFGRLKKLGLGRQHPAAALVSQVTHPTFLLDWPVSLTVGILFSVSHKTLVMQFLCLSATCAK